MNLTEQLCTNQRAKHLSTGNFQTTMHQGYKANSKVNKHNPYESFPNTVLYKESNTGDNSSSQYGHEEEVLTQM
jgi:hypothetical protein